MNIVNHVNTDGFNSRIPVISLDDFRDSNRRGAFVDELGRAFQEHGFVGVTGADIDQNILDTGFKAIKEFFAMSEEYKNSIHSETNNGERGYNVNETPKLQPIHVTDFKELLHIGREMNPEQEKRLNYEKNLWPKDSNLKNGTMPLYNELERIMDPIAEAASEYLGEDPRLFPEMMVEAEHLLRPLHYLRSPGQSKNWAATHTDMNFLTFIPGGASKGLQVQLKDGSWVDALVPKNAIVVNVGDSLENLTNGFYRSGVHRVVALKDAPPERWSIVYAGHTRHELDMGPLPSAIAKTGGVQKFPNGKGWELLYAQIAAVGRATRPMLEELAKCGVMERKIKLGKASEKVMRILARENLASEAVLTELKRIDSEKK